MMRSKSTIQAKIRSFYPSLSKKDSELANFILKFPHRFSRMTIKEIAEELNMAESTVFQFAKKLGFSSFTDFKTKLLTEELDPAISIHEHISSEDSPLIMAQKVFKSNIDSLENTVALLTEKDLLEAISLITSSEKVTFFGIGGSNAVALDAFHKFLRSPIPVRHSLDSNIQLMFAGLMSEKDCIISISHTGETNELIQMTKLAKARKAKIIGITSFPTSSLAKLSDVLFVSVAEETEFRRESLSSRISQLAILDSLYMAVMFNNEEKSNEYLAKVREAVDIAKSSY